MYTGTVDADPEDVNSLGRAMVIKAASEALYAPTNETAIHEMELAVARTVSTKMGSTVEGRRPNLKSSCMIAQSILAIQRKAFEKNTEAIRGQGSGRSEILHVQERTSDIAGQVWSHFVIFARSAISLTCSCPCPAS